MAHRTTILASLPGTTITFTTCLPAIADLIFSSDKARSRIMPFVYDNEWAMSWTLRDGRVTKWQIFEDTARELAAHAPASAGARSGGVSA